MNIFADAIGLATSRLLAKIWKDRQEQFRCEASKTSCLKCFVGTNEAVYVSLDVCPESGNVNVRPQLFELPAIISVYDNRCFSRLAQVVVKTSVSKAASFAWMDIQDQTCINVIFETAWQICFKSWAGEYSRTEIDTSKYFFDTMADRDQKNKALLLMSMLKFLSGKDNVEQFTQNLALLSAIYPNINFVHLKKLAITKEPPKMIDGSNPFYGVGVNRLDTTIGALRLSETITKDS